MPRANLLIADDVGLGKTVETGLVILELILRHRARTALVVCPSALQIQWRDQMRDKFGLEFVIVDSKLFSELRRKRGLQVNPWTHWSATDLTRFHVWAEGHTCVITLRMAAERECGSSRWVRPTHGFPPYERH